MHVSIAVSIFEVILVEFKILRQYGFAKKVKNTNSFYVCFTAFLVLCELPPSGRKFGFSHELSDLAHLTLLAGPIGFNEIGQLSQITLASSSFSSL